MGAEVPEEELDKNAIFVLINNDLSFVREQDRFGRPSIKYKKMAFSSLMSLDLEEAEKSYHLIKIFNPDKI